MNVQPGDGGHPVGRGHLVWLAEETLPANTQTPQRPGYPSYPLHAGAHNDDNYYNNNHHCENDNDDHMDDCPGVVPVHLCAHATMAVRTQGILTI